MPVEGTPALVHNVELPAYLSFCWVVAIVDIPDTISYFWKPLTYLPHIFVLVTHDVVEAIQPACLP
jgi:hypothetical protein